MLSFGSWCILHCIKYIRGNTSVNSITWNRGVVAQLIEKNKGIHDFFRQSKQCLGLLCCGTAVCIGKRMLSRNSDELAKVA